MLFKFIGWKFNFMINFFGIFSRAVSLWLWVKILFLFLNVCMVKMDLEMKFGDVLDCSWGNLDHIWKC